MNNSNLLSNIDLNNDQELLGKFICSAPSPFGALLIVKVTAKKVLAVDTIAQKWWRRRDELTVDKDTYRDAEQGHGWVYGIFDQPVDHYTDWPKKIDWVIYTIKKRYNITLDRNKVKIQSTKFFDSKYQAATIVTKAIASINRIKYTSLQFLTIEESIPNVKYIVNIRDLKHKKEESFALDRGYFDDDYQSYDKHMQDINKSSLDDLNKALLRIAYKLYQYFKK